MPSGTVAQQAIDCVPGTKSYQRATTATAELIVIPTEMRNMYCTFAARTEDVWIRFGTGTAVAVLAEVSGLAAGVLTEDVNTPHLHVPAGQERTRRLPYGRITHFSHISAGATGFLIFGCTTGAGTKDDA